MTALTAFRVWKKRVKELEQETETVRIACSVMGKSVLALCEEAEKWAVDQSCTDTAKDIRAVVGELDYELTELRLRLTDVRKERTRRGDPKSRDHVEEQGGGARTRD